MAQSGFIELRRLRSIYLFLLSAGMVFAGCASQQAGYFPPEIKRRPLHSYFRDQNPSFMARADSTMAQKRAMEFFFQGSSLQMNQKYAEAILSYQRALRLDSSASIWYCIGRCYEFLGQTDMAEEYVQQALQRDSMMIPAIELLAMIRLEQQQIQQCVDLYERILQMDSNRVSALYALAGLNESIAPDESILLYRRILRHTGPDEDIIRRLGTLLVRQDKDREYIQLIEEYAAAMPESGHARAVLIEAYANYNHFEQAYTAIKNFSRTSLADELAEYYQTISFALLLLEDTAQQSKYARLFLQEIEQMASMDWKVNITGALLAEQAGIDDKAGRLHSRAFRLADTVSEEYALGLGIELLRNSLYGLAFSYLQRYKELFPGNARFPFFAGISKISSGDYPMAALLFRQSARLNPDYADTWAELGTVYLRMKKHDSAYTAFAKAIELDPGNALYNNNFAYTLAEQKTQLDKALHMAEFAIKAQPGNSSFLDTYGWTLYQMGRYTESVQYLEKAAYISSPPSAVIFGHLGDAYMRLDQKEKARRVYQQAFDIEPLNEKWSNSLRATE
jgi:tetratricopeptide (TPR) repeat protein